jgi:hypothetical protein
VEPARVNGGWIRGSVLRPRTNFLLVAVNKPLTFFESAPFPGGFESGVPRKWVMRHDIRLPSGSNGRNTRMPPLPQVARLRFTRVTVGDYVGAAWTTNMALIPPAAWIEPAPVPGPPRGRVGRIVLPLGNLPVSPESPCGLCVFTKAKVCCPQRDGRARVFSHEDRDCLALILQGKRLGFTLTISAKCWRHVRTAAPRTCRSIAQSVLSRSRCWSAGGAKLTGRWPSYDGFTPTYSLYRMSGRPAHPDRSEPHHRSTRSRDLNTRVNQLYHNADRYDR